jgi:quinol monooxygenase YgiN
MNGFSDKVNFIWSVADLIRDTFKRSKYQDVILPFTVLRRIDCVLQPTKARVLEVNHQLKGSLENLAPQLRRAAGYAFYNTSPYDFERLLSDAPHLAANLRAYINDFSENMREVLEKFDFNNTIGKLDEAGLLFLVMEKFKVIDLQVALSDTCLRGERPIKEKDMSAYGCYVKFVARPGQLETLVELLLQAAAGVEAAPGCELYIINTSPTEAESVWVTEVWRSLEEHDASLSIEGAQELIKQVRPLLAGPPERIEVLPVGGKGLATA